VGRLAKHRQRISGRSRRSRVDDGCVNREDLLATLRHAEGEAVETCIALLTDPDFVVRIEGDWERPAVTANLLTIYRRRASHVRRVGLPTLGFDETCNGLSPRRTSN
jgi:hypothetical protein